MSETNGRLRELRAAREKLQKKKEQAAGGAGAGQGGSNAEKGSASGSRERIRARAARRKKSSTEGGSGGTEANSGGRFGDSVPLRGRKKRSGGANDAGSDANAAQANNDDISEADSDASTVEGAETPRGAPGRKNLKDFVNTMVTTPLTKNFSEFPFLASGSPGSLLFPRSMTRAQLEDLIARTSSVAATSSEMGSGFYVPHTPFYANNNDAIGNDTTSKQNTAGRVRLRLMRELDANTPLASTDVGKKTTTKDIDPDDVDAVKGVVRENWFQKNGLVRTMADPIDGSRKMPFALATMGAITDAVKPAVFRTSHLQGQMGGTGQSLSKRRSQISVRIGRLRFTHHGLFDSEDSMSSELISLHSEYWSTVSSDIEAHCLARVLSRGADLYSRRQEVIQYNLMDSRQGDELIAATLDLFNAWSEYIAVFRSVRKLERAVYAAWRRLRAYREEVGISRTSTKLSVRQMAPAVPSKAGWDRVILSMRLLEDVLELIEPRLLEMGMNNASGMSANLKDRAISEFEAFTTQDLSPMRNKDAVPLLVLSEKHPITPTGELDPKGQRGEVKRRALVENKRYYGRVMINNHHVANTRVSSLRWPTFECDFASEMNIEVTRRPRKVALEIWERAGIFGSLSDVRVGTLPISLQGPEHGAASSTATAPVRQLYSFASSNPIKGSAARASAAALGSGANAENDEGGDEDEDDGDGGSSNNVNRSKGSKQPLMMKAAEYTRGRVEVTTAWIGWLSGHVDLEGERVLAPLPPDQIESERARLVGGAVDVHGNLASRATATAGYGKGHETHEQSGMRLAAMAGSARYDPNDPKNQALEKVKKRSETSRKTLALGGAEVFRVESHAEANEARFASRDSQRFRMPDRQVLLQMRHEMPHLFRHGKPLPLTDEEVMTDPHWRVMLAPKMQKKRRSSMTVEEKLEEDEEEALEYFGFDSEFLVKRQNRMRSFIEKLRTTQLELRGKRRRRAFLATHVREGILPDFNLDLSFIQRKLAPKRQLRPSQKKRKEVPMVKDVYLVVQVAGAIRVPQRRFMETDFSKASGGPPSPKRGRSPDRRGANENRGGEVKETNYDDDDDDDVSNLAGGSSRINTFVEASFQGQNSRTTSRGGTMPVWNETLRCRFVPQFSGAGSRWTASNLRQVRDKINLSLFDEQVHKNESDFRHRNAINIRRERRYLGSVSIPFTTIYNRKQISGLFRLDRPVVNVAYEHPPAPGVEEGEVIVPGSEKALKLEADEATYVRLMITLDPPLVDQEEPYDNSGGYVSETKAVVQRATNFAKLANEDFGPGQVIVPNLNGERCLVSRFVCPQTPPMGVKTIMEAARFVSLVPFMEDWQLFVGNEDMWSTSDQFLELCAGDWEEHAVLLRNFFSFLDQKSGAANESFIVFGHGIPEGDTVYVMRRPRDSARDGVTLWNAATGIEYSALDPRCPLQTISMVVGENNMYINAQSVGMPSRIMFDFGNKKNWKPFFTAKLPMPDDYRHCQPEINYIVTPDKEVDGLERQIMETLKIDLKEWRSKSYQTYLNQSVARDLQKTLESLESLKRGAAGYNEDVHLDMLKKWTNSYDMNGYPLNFTFTDVKAISYAVKDTGIHLNEDPNVKFAITVKCFGYACGVVSVWVYVAALVRKR